MFFHRCVKPRNDDGTSSTVLYVMWVFALLFSTAASLVAQEKRNPPDSGPSKDSIGFVASKEATAKEVGLPIYPGARRHPEEGSESAGVKLGMWSGVSGFKLVVLKLESDDSRDKVEAFYRQALAKYGKVLNCSDPSQGAASKDKGKSNEIDCEADRPEKDETVLKAGTKQEQHVVGIRPNGSHCSFDLVYVESRE